MGRYYCVQFVYNLRFFGKKGSKNIKDYQGVSTARREPSVWDAAPLPEAGSVRRTGKAICAPVWSRNIRYDY